MEIETFIENIKGIFEDIDASDFNANTSFRLNDEYSSLSGLAIIAMIDEKYHVSITGNELKIANTINDLFNLVKSKK